MDLARHPRSQDRLVGHLAGPPLSLDAYPGVFTQQPVQADGNPWPTVSSAGYPNAFGPALGAPAGELPYLDRFGFGETIALPSVTGTFGGLFTALPGNDRSGLTSISTYQFVRARMRTAPSIWAAPGAAASCPAQTRAVP